MTGAAACVLDSSALLAILNGETGAEVVLPLLDGAFMSAVNWSETLQKTIERNVPNAHLRSDVEALGVSIMPFGVEDGERAASLWTQTQPLGLSFGDRACLALAVSVGVRAVTADRAWASLSIDVEVEVIR